MAYELFQLAPASKEVLYKNPDEALLAASNMVVSPTEILIGDLKVNKAGQLVLGENDTRFITKHGLESFCKILGIPTQFARVIPEELLLTNIQRLSNERASDSVTVLERPNGEIASIVKAPYKEIPYADVLSSFIDRVPSEIALSETLMRALFIYDKEKVPGFDDSLDTFYIHENLLASINGSVKLQATAGLYRTQCTNSFILPLFGKLSANYQFEPEKRLGHFADAFKFYSTEGVDLINNRFANQKEITLYEHQVKVLWEKFSVLASKSEADKLFGFQEEDIRNALLANAREYLASFKRAKDRNETPPPPTPTFWKGYDIANSITQHAHEVLHDLDRMRAEALGGSIIQWMIFN